MRERPMPFNAEMVRAILAGDKTQTRRPIKNAPAWAKCVFTDGNGRFYFHTSPDGIGSLTKLIKSPFGRPGDRLWVREKFAAPKRFDHLSPRALQQDSIIPQLTYFARPTESKVAGVGKTRLSRHMPRLCSRIDLLVKRVWVERVQDISSEDAIEEGIEQIGDHEGQPLWRDYSLPPEENDGCNYFTDHRKSFWSLWDSIYGNQEGLAMEKNPWVWCCEFERIRS